MGHYSQLYIGKLYLSWKSNVPSFLTFLFEKNSYYCIRNDEEEYFEEIGYKTSVSESLEILDRFGYNLEFFAQVYEQFYSDLHTYFLEVAKEEISKQHEHSLPEEQINEALAEHLEKFPVISRKSELEDFVIFIRTLIFSSDTETQIHKITFKDGKEYTIDSSEYLKHNSYESWAFLDYEELQMYMYGKYMQFPPWLIRISQLFDFDYTAEYPEIIELMFLRCVLEALPPDEEVKLELSDLIDSEEEVLNLHSSLANQLVTKVNLYSKVFHTLFQKEVDIRTRYIRDECRVLLETCLSSDKYQKGIALEQLTELLFGENGSFEIIDKRVSTGDEEIDLLVKNTIDSPFWLAFGSPLFFIECKNWNKAIGSKEIRDFEIKLQNHSKLAKLGFFFSYNGFTSEARVELKRAGREDYHIVFIEKKDIDEYLISDKPFYKWLENIVSKPH